MAEIEKVRILRTLKCSNKVYQVGEEIVKPIPPDLLIEIDKKTGTVEPVFVPTPKKVEPIPVPEEQKQEVKPEMSEEQAEPEKQEEAEIETEEIPHKKFIQKVHPKR